MFDGMTRKEWERWECVENDFRAHPTRYRLRLAALFAEGAVVGTLLVALVAVLVAICIADPGRNVRLIVFLLVNVVGTVWIYLAILAQRPWTGLTELTEAEWPRLHELVREAATAAGAPRIHRIYLHPEHFNAGVAVSFPLVPPLRRNMLILGYPLLAACGARGLRAILAHELGHVAHRDLVHGGALLHVKAFWLSVQLGLFTWALGPWRRSYLRRLDRLMSPLERERELAADRAIAERLGPDALREMLVTLELREHDADIGEILYPLHGAGEDGGPSPSAAIRAALRRKLPEGTVRRRLSRALRAIVPPMEEHPPLAVRAGTLDVGDLLPCAGASQDALETFFGSADALDATVDAIFRPACATAERCARDSRATAEKMLSAIPGDDLSPDADLERIGLLRSLDREEEADRLLLAARAAHPENAALESVELRAKLMNAGSAAEGAPIADRLETLLAAAPMLLPWVEDPLFAHYLETGAADRIKRLLDLRRRVGKPLFRRLHAKLKPTDAIRAAPLSDSERETFATKLAGHHVREAYAVLRTYEGTGVSSSFLVIRWRMLANPSRELPDLNEAFDSQLVVSGTHALFRRFAELGVEPICVPPKA